MQQTEKNFTVYRSSAGSGKTFTLVKEYLVLALADPLLHPGAYRHILAVTFTNKAAAEMKERIIRSLKELALEDYAQLSFGGRTLLHVLLSDTKLNAGGKLSEAILRERSKQVLTSILHNYSDFAIGTIDAFVHKVVRAFAYDLKIPMQFDLEMDGDKLLQMAIDLLLAKLGNDEVLTKAMVAFVESKTDDEKSWHIEQDLLHFAKNLLNEEGGLYLERLKELTIEDFTAIREKLENYRNHFEINVRKIASDAVGLIESEGLSYADFYQGKSGVFGYLSRIANGDFEKLKLNSHVEKTVGEDKWPSPKTGKGQVAAIERIKSHLLDAVSQLESKQDDEYKKYVLYGLINRTIYSLAVLHEIEVMLDQYKAGNNIVHIAEFNKMIAKIVLTEPIPFIYERLGEKYNNYLVDEFQDTSILQFQNLLPLIDNALSNGNFNMLVGDGKQAIYRWRGGEVEQFALLPKLFSHKENPLVKEREEALIRNFGLEVLNKNFRSKREIIEFNNSFFRCIAQGLNPKYQNIYDSLEQEFDPDKTGGYVQVEFILEEKDEARDRHLLKTLEIIRAVQSDNYRLQDVAILVRKNTDGSDIANYLAKNGIPVISSDSLLLSNSHKVNFICSVLRYLSNSAEPIVHAEIVEFLLKENYLSSATLSGLIDQLNARKLVKLIQGIAPGFHPVALSKMALYELTEEIIRLFQLNKSPDAYLQFFLDEVLQYSLKKNNNLADFLDYWDEKKEVASLIIPEGMDAVQIMTIHRSKGLEFPVVILPFANGRVKNGKDHLWIDLKDQADIGMPVGLVPASKSLESTDFAADYEIERGKSLLDNMNVLYVALTRPEERLYVLTGKPTQTPENMSNWSDLFAYYYKQQQLFQPAQYVYSFGEAKRANDRGKRENNDYALTVFHSTNWRESIKMRAAAPGIWNTNFSEQKKDRGVLMHTILARVVYADQVESSLNAVFAEGLIDGDEHNSLKAYLYQVVQHPEIAEYFDKRWKVRNEAEIVSSGTTLARPDRVVIKGKDAVVIDYKTGRKQVAHADQLHQYAELLKEMGYQVNKCLVVYLDPLEVVLV